MHKESITFMSTILKEDLYDFINKIKSEYSLIIKKDRFIVLKSDQFDYLDYFFVFYQVENQIEKQLPKIKNTTMINKKGTCFFTVNALNKLIQKQNGERNNEYVIDWSKEQYTNKIFFTNNNQLIQINTIIHDIKH